MKERKCTALDLPRLTAYWLGELEEFAQSQVEEHLFGCAHCTRRLQFLAEVAGGVRALVHRGALGLSVTHAFLERLRAEGLRVREYRVGPGGSVNCTITPHDDFVIGRMQAPLQGVARLDAELLSEGQPTERHNDILFDAEMDEVLIMPTAGRVRAIQNPTVERVRLLAVDQQGERLIGEYQFKHTPYTGS